MVKKSMKKKIACLAAVGALCGTFCFGSLASTNVTVVSAASAEQSTNDNATSGKYKLGIKHVYLMDVNGVSKGEHLTANEAGFENYITMDYDKFGVTSYIGTKEVTYGGKKGHIVKLSNIIAADAIKGHDGSQKLEKDLEPIVQDEDGYTTVFKVKEEHFAKNFRATVEYEDENMEDAVFNMAIFTDASGFGYTDANKGKMPENKKEGIYDCLLKGKLDNIDEYENIKDIEVASNSSKTDNASKSNDGNKVATTSDENKADATKASKDTKASANSDSAKATNNANGSKLDNSPKTADASTTGVMVAMIVGCASVFAMVAVTMKKKKRKYRIR